MINQQYKAMLSGKSIIRELSEYATERGREIGCENVFDYSLGNPSVPCTQSFTDAMLDLLHSSNPVSIHGYSPSLGIQSVRQSVAESLNRRFGTCYETKHIFMTCGAAGAVAHAVRCVTQPGDEVLTFAPFFPEYTPYVNQTGAVLKVVPANTENFQINFDAFEQMLTEKVMAVLINTPNNPSGVVYTTATITRLADILRRKQKQYGHEIPKELGMKKVMLNAGLSSQSLLLGKKETTYESLYVSHGLKQYMPSEKGEVDSHMQYSLFDTIAV